MFCRKCGKDIGECKFCPECGTKQTPTEGAEPSEALKQEASAQEASVVVQSVASLNIGEDGELIKDDGKRVYPSAQRALEAPVKQGSIYKARNGLMKAALIFYLIAGGASIVACVDDAPAFFDAIIVPLFLIGIAFNIPSAILNHIFVEMKCAKWLKEKNVDIMETIKSGSSSKDDKLYAERMVVMKYLNDNPKSHTLYIINGILGIFLSLFISTSFMLFFAKLPDIVNIFRFGSFADFNTPFWLNTVIYGVVTSASIVVPTAVTGTIFKNRAKESYASEEQGIQAEQGEQK